MFAVVLMAVFKVQAKERGKSATRVGALVIRILTLIRTGRPGTLSQARSRFVALVPPTLIIVSFSPLSSHQAAYKYVQRSTIQSNKGSALYAKV
jgi:hypothetical protein